MNNRIKEDKHRIKQRSNTIIVHDIISNDEVKLLEIVEQGEFVE